MYALAEPPVAGPHADDVQGPHRSEGEVLWRAGSFVCDVRSVEDPACPAVLCVSRHGEPVLELPVLSALDAEERAYALRGVVERHQSA